MKLPIITERLILRKLTRDDVDNIFLLDSNPDVMKYVGVPAVSNKAESEKMIDNFLNQYQKNGTGRLAVIEKESNQFVGWSGIKLLTDEVNGFKNVTNWVIDFFPNSGEKAMLQNLQKRHWIWDFTNSMLIKSTLMLMSKTSLQIIFLPK